MLQRKVLATLVVAMAFGATAQAQSTGTTVGSEEFFQVGAGQHAASGKLGYLLNTSRTKAAGASDVKDSGLINSGLFYEYGFSEMLALQGTLTFRSTEFDTTPKVKSSGLEDPTLTLKVTTPMEFGRLRYGLTGGLGGFSKAKAGGTDNDAMTGGFSLTPYVGVDMDAGPGILGARLSYAFLLERTQDRSNGVEAKVTGGDTLGIKAFYEYILSDMLLGGSINYAATNDSKSKINNTETTSQGFNTTGLSLYARIPAGVDLIPRLDYDFAHSELDKYSNMTLSLTARYLY